MISAKCLKVNCQATNRQNYTFRRRSRTSVHLLELLQTPHSASDRDSCAAKVRPLASARSLGPSLLPLSGLTLNTLSAVAVLQGPLLTPALNSAFVRVSAGTVSVMRPSKRKARISPLTAKAKCVRVTILQVRPFCLRDIY